MESILGKNLQNKNISDLIMQKISSLRSEENEDAFFVCDLGDVVRKYNLWLRELPRVTPFYAVKCNDDPKILQLLDKLGTGFDCASKAELQKILSLNVSKDRIIYANPCKQVSHIRYAAKANVSLMTFDNMTELHKIKKAFPTAKIVLRILPPESDKVQCPLGIKFGAHPDQVDVLLQTAKELELDLVGISFHVGSGCYDAAVFAESVKIAHGVFEQAREYGFKPTLLDIGGGFPGQNSAKITFPEICNVLRPALDRYFPPSSGVELIAEPGRFFVASAFTLTVNIIAKRRIPEVDSIEDDYSDPMFMYYVNDGVYGSFNCLLFDHAEVEVTIPQAKRYASSPRYKSSIWGPTCDGLDCILEEVKLPQLDTGDWLIFKDMGAYTLSASSTFNGMPRPLVHYSIEDGIKPDAKNDCTADSRTICRMEETPIRPLKGKILIEQETYA